MTAAAGGEYEDSTIDELALSDDMRRFYDALIDTVYSDALECVNSQRHARHRDTSAISRSNPETSARHFEIVSRLLLERGLAALSLSKLDFGLAERMFDDSISVIPSGLRFPEPFFFKLYIQITYDWPPEETNQTARVLLEHDPHIASRAERLLAQLPESLVSSPVKLNLFAHISLESAVTAS